MTHLTAMGTILDEDSVLDAADLYGFAARQAAEHLRKMPRERRAQLEREWEGEARAAHALNGRLM